MYTLDSIMKNVNDRQSSLSTKHKPVLFNKNKNPPFKVIMQERHVNFNL